MSYPWQANFSFYRRLHPSKKKVNFTGARERLVFPGLVMAACSRMFHFFESVARRGRRANGIYAGVTTVQRLIYCILHGELSSYSVTTSFRKLTRRDNGKNKDWGGPDRWEITSSADFFSSIERFTRRFSSPHGFHDRENDGG